MKKIYLIIGILALIPFRLPVTYVVINIFQYCASIGGFEIPTGVMYANIIATKFIYDLLFIPCVWGLLKFTNMIDVEGKVAVTIIFFIFYLIYDLISTGSILDVIL